MMEEFSEIAFKVLINGTWVDLSPDILAIPAPMVSGIGIMSNNPLDRVGGTSRLTFSLNNSESNSAGQRGYYTPGGVNSLNGWDSGLFVRLYFVYDGIYKNVFYGRIDADGIQVVSGIYGRRNVDITASGWMRETERQSIEQVDYATNIRSDIAAALVVAAMQVPPLAQAFQVGSETFPTVFDITQRDTKAAGEFGKITDSEFGFLYVRGDVGNSDSVGGEVLVFENRQWRYSQRNLPSSVPVHSTLATDLLLLETGDYMLLETGDKILLEAAQPAFIYESNFTNLQTSYGKHLYNRARISGYPRKIDDAPVVLWNLESVLEIPAGETIRGLRGSYRDPNGKINRVSGINMVAPDDGTDYTANTAEDGSGTDKTSMLTVSAQYFVAEVEYTLTNTDTVTIYVTKLQARGYGVYIYDTASILYESQPSIARYGVREIEFTLPYISNVTGLFSSYASNLDDTLLETGDKLLLENGDFMLADDEAGVFDLLVYDEPYYHVEQAELVANRSKYEMMLFMGLTAGSFVKMQETMTEITTDNTYIINGYDLELVGGKIVKWRPSLVSSMVYPRI